MRGNKSDRINKVNFSKQSNQKLSNDSNEKNNTVNSGLKTGNSQQNLLTITTEKQTTNIVGIKEAEKETTREENY